MVAGVYSRVLTSERPKGRQTVPARCIMLVLTAAVASSLGMQEAVAQITEIRVDPIDNSSGGPALDNFITNDVVISFDGRYTGSQLLVTLDQGSIYQDPDGDIATPPFTSASVEFDTFVAQGLPTVGVIDYDQPNGNILGAINLGGAHPGTFDSMLLNIAWHPTPSGGSLDDLSDLLTARITLSDDAIGTWSYLASAKLEITIEDRLIDNGMIRNGQLLVAAAVPEPPAAVLLVIAVAALAPMWRAAMEALRHAAHMSCFIVACDLRTNRLCRPRTTGYPIRVSQNLG